MEKTTQEHTLGDWRIVSPGTSAPPLADVFRWHPDGWWEWHAIVDVHDGESLEDALRRATAG